MATHEISNIKEDWDLVIRPQRAWWDLRLGDLWKYRDLIRFVTDRPGHDRRYAIDSAKIQRELGWQPEVGFEAGLRRTVEWYLSNPKWVDQASGGSYGEWIEKNYAWRAGKESK